MNWSAILTLPLWGGIYLVVTIWADAYNGDKNTIDALAGKKLMME